MERKLSKEYEYTSAGFSLASENGPHVMMTFVGGGDKMAHTWLIIICN